jgi:hypothetical protein
MFDANHAPILHKHQHRVQMDRNEIPDDSHRLGVPLSASKMISEPMVRLTQTVHLSSFKISTISKLTDLWAYGSFGIDRVPILHQE